MNDDIILMLSGTEEIRSRLDEIPFRKYLDLIVYYLVGREMIGNGERRGIELRPLDDQEAAARGFTDEEDLYEIALHNTVKRFPPHITDMSDGMYCLTNEQNIFGAAVMLYDDELKKVSELIGSSMYVVPFSIHEVICIKHDIADPADIYDFIKTADEEIVDEKDHLSDSIYYYDKDNDKMMIAYSQDGYYM